MKRVYIVEAEKDGALHYWAAATPPENATRAVRQQVGGGWQVRLTDRVLTAQQVASLNVPAGRVHRIKFMKFN